MRVAVLLSAWAVLICGCVEGDYDPAPLPTATTTANKPAQDDAPTSSINHPVPPGNVGGPLKKRQMTILDILSGG